MFYCQGLIVGRVFWQSLFAGGVLNHEIKGFRCVNRAVFMVHPSRNFKIALKGFPRDQGKTQKGNGGYLL